MRNGISKRKKVVIGIVFLLLLVYWFSLPAKLFDKPLSTVVLSSDGRLLGARIANDGQWRFPPLDSVPYKFEKCIITFEDKYFFYHPGVNIVSLFRAAYQDVKAGKIVSGGSTLTMQVARMNSSHSSRNIINKLLEIIMATRIEISYSKNEILNLYASNAPFGGNVVGLYAASWRYFHRSPYELSWAETATLAVLPNAPSLIYPGKNQQQLLKKRNRLLKKLLDKKIISQMDYDLSISEKLPERIYPLPMLALHLTERINAKENGKIVSTTIDYNLQKITGKMLKSYSQLLKTNNISNAAVIVARVDNGDILAYHGNIPQTNDNKTENGFVDIITSRRSSGSTLKPLLYAGLFDEGSLLPQMLVPDIPTYIHGYNPQNFHHEYDGLVPASQALARSLNVPAVRLLRRYGVRKMLDLLHKTGFTTINRSASNYGLSLILGGAEVTPEELAGVYASMARVLLNFNSAGYNLNDWHGLQFLKRKRKKKTPVQGKILSAPAIYETFTALTDANRPANESGWKLFSFTEPVAWKTGTSYGFRDAWSVGVTAKYVVAVWVGNADGEGRPGMTGITAAAPLMFDIFNHLDYTGWFTRPTAAMTKVKICNQSGYKAGPYCENIHYEYVTANSDRLRICPYHKIIHLDPSEKYQVNSSCENVAQMIHKSWFVLPPVYEYYYKKKNPTYQPPPKLRNDCGGAVSATVMEFVYPQNGTKIFIPRSITGEKSAVVFTATHSGKTSVIYWHIDGVYVGTTRDNHHLQLAPPPGKHTVTIVDQQGNSISCRFEVIAGGGRPDGINCS